MKGKNIHIEHPEVWELLVSIDGKQVNYILHSPSVPGSLIIDGAELTADTLQALEDAIYDNEVLLNEYKRVRVVVHSQHFVLLPIDTPDDDCVALVHQAFPTDQGDVVLNVMSASNVKLVFLVPHGMQAFLGRTFNYPIVYHHMWPLCEHFKGIEAAGGLSRMFLNVNEGRMDMAIYRRGELMCANSYTFTSNEDATYYALNAWRSYGLDQLADEIQLLGDNTVRNEMTPHLRQYVKHVMPAVYPAAAMQLGHNAMQAPLELILLALCE